MDNSRSTSLRTWLVWLGMLLLAGAAIAVSFAISWTSSEHSRVVEFVMYAVILGLAAILFTRQYLVMRMLQFEENRAGTIIADLQASIRDDKAALAKGEKPSATRRAILALGSKVPNRSDATPHGAKRYYFERHISALASMSTTREPSQSVLIEILHERLSADNKTVELFSSVLITLGLIGTILGLMLMMESLTGVMTQNASGDGLLQALAGDDGPLAGLGVAFMTTLMGSILGGVVLRVLTSQVERTISEFVALVAELTEVHILGILQR